MHKIPSNISKNLFRLNLHQTNLTSPEKRFKFFTLSRNFFCVRAYVQITAVNNLFITHILDIKNVLL
ncbi:hypothetical protein OLMES_4050 [Oleiphilus messinensis]|uniref:Uncharacterized protein n=1 Tax=Oleiphilus messinensis TaxID=141451 RepID=A0A1Y0IC13_9GAMM|nr:hypothetical protein OLMES_4050 [Oleiphilus messinensis]